MTWPDQARDTVLSVDRVAAIYHRSIMALHDVSLTVQRGEITALIGANGAGKTTTLRAVSNLLPAERGHLTSGEIKFMGYNVSRTTPAKLVRLGLATVLEGRHCFPSLTVEENLVTGGVARGSSRRELDHDLERAYTIFPRLRDKRKTISGLTSGGEQQMTAVARALMSRPKLLVLDEPSMGLAPRIVQQIFHTLKRLNESEGLSILLAEQNSTVALQYADRVVVLETGLTVLDGLAAELRDRTDIRNFYLGEMVLTNSDHSRPIIPNGSAHLSA